VTLDPPSVGERFPVAILTDLGSSPVSLARYGGSALILNFWATWCEPCRREMPSLQKLGTLFRPDALQVVGIAVDDDVNLVREFVLRYGIGFPVLLDRDQRLAHDVLRLPGFPTTYLVRRDGVIAARVIGDRDWAEEASLREIERLLLLERRV